MPLFDLPLAELESYAPQIPEPADFDAFWARTIAESRALAADPVFERAATPYTAITTYDVTFSGYLGASIKGWLSVPAGAPGPLPLVVEYIGYGAGRGLSHQFVGYALAGYAHFVMDNRGMGWGGLVGDTTDAGGAGRPPGAPGFMTDGIAFPDTHYFRRLMTDAVLAVDAARRHPLVDPSRTAISGGSMGGGLTLAVAGLRDDIDAALVDVPFLCHISRGIRISPAEPFMEVRRFVSKDRRFAQTADATLAYFDAALHARRASAPALFSVGLMDEICPPSTVYAAFNGYAQADKQIEVYEFNGHDGGGEFHEVLRFDWLRRCFATG